MPKIEAGDLVRVRNANYDMLVISCDDVSPNALIAALTFVCAWEDSDALCTEIFPTEQLEVVRKERRRIPRGGVLQFPIKTG